MKATKKHTAGPWIVATSNSWRRIVSDAPTGGTVCEPIKQRDGHPDLFFPNGGFEGPDARLLAAAPNLLEALTGLIEAVVKDSEEKGISGFTGARLEDARAAIASATGG